MANDAEDVIIRRYLQLLADDASAVDLDAVAVAEKALARAVDPVERLRARQGVLDARQPKVEEIRADFRRYVERWATRNGVSREALLAEGVPEADLIGVGRKSQSRKSRSSRVGRTLPGSKPAKRVVTDDHVLASLDDKVGRPLDEIAPAVRMSESWTRKALARLVTSGRVVREETAPKGSGRPAAVYRSRVGV